MSKKIYILIGGNGFIGSYMQKKLQKNNLPFIVIDKNESKIVNNGYIKGNFEQNINIVLDEIKKLTSINDIIEVHHLAAIVSVPDVINSKNYFNEEIILNFAVKEFIAKLKEFRKNINFIYYSSSEVYGDIEYQFENKNTSEAPIESNNFLRERYNIMKTFNEYYFNDNEINYLVIRPYNVVGEGQRENFVIPKMVKDAVFNKKIVIYGDGSQSRVFIHVEDFIDAVFQAIDKILDKKEFNYKILNIANSSNYITIKKLANLIADKVSYEIKEIIKIEYKNESIKVGAKKRIPDLQRLYTDLQFRPQKKLDKIIEDYIKWYLV